MNLIKKILRTFLHSLIAILVILLCASTSATCIGATVVGEKDFMSIVGILLSAVTAIITLMFLWDFNESDRRIRSATR